MMGTKIISLIPKKSKAHMSLAAKIFHMLPPQVQAAAEVAFGGNAAFNPWGGPFNGQTGRREVFRKAFHRCRPDAIIETGTFRGSTTEFFADFGVDVISVENTPRFFYFAKRRLSHLKKVKLVLDDSVHHLRRSYQANHFDCIFAYLDSHWYGNLPLREEIMQITRISSRYVIFIDDFRVPQMPDYEFDDYGKAGSCTLEYIKPTLPTEAKVFFPRIPAIEETGRKRGYCCIAFGEREAKVLSECEELVQHEMTS